MPGDCTRRETGQCGVTGRSGSLPILLDRNKTQRAPEKIGNLPDALALGEMMQVGQPLSNLGCETRVKWAKNTGVKKGGLG